ncbi:hypothetical protein KQX54_011488 [Cotesia glomerata]|uniref:Uncharacterized protein n=1 Tax=Cotesia glomerata TaxID=32391 RepID=A0AAV7ICQ1_COTGL|nr:hypothetical protein KQX54_011488 [Cotesia glomerata]
MSKRKNKKTIEQIVKKLRIDKEQSDDNEGEASGKTHEVDPAQEFISSSDSEKELPEQPEDDGKADEAKGRQSSQYQQGNVGQFRPRLTFRQNQRIPFKQNNQALRSSVPQGKSKQRNQ